MRARRVGAVLLALSLVVAFAGTASAQKYGKEWDPYAAVERGEYLDDEAYSKLKAEQAMAYCSALEEQLADSKNELADTRRNLDGERGEADQLRKQVGSLDNRIANLQSDVMMLEREYGPYRNKKFSHTVVKGEYLSMIAEYDDVYGDAMKWPRLYRANRDEIEDPNLIYPDQVFKIAHGYPKWHLVVDGEFLSKIANYWEIYNDGREWPRLYEANRDQIRDPDLIYPDQVLTIPR